MNRNTCNIFLKNRFTCAQLFCKMEKASCFFAEWLLKIAGDLLAGTTGSYEALESAIPYHFPDDL